MLTNCNRFGANPGVYNDKIFYRGPVGSVLTAGDLANTQISYFPNSPTNRLPQAAQDPFERDNYQQNAAIVKLQYQRNFSSKSYARVYGYTEYSDWLQYGEGGLNANFTSSISSDYKLGAHTRGVGFNYANQLSDKHLLNFTANYTTASTFRNNDSAVTLSGTTTAANSNTVAFLVNSLDPTAGLCYTATGAPVNCSSATSARYTIPGLPATATGPLPLVPSSAVTVGNAGSITCGSGPCEFLTVANGLAASYNTVTPKFTALAISDKFQVNAKLSLDFGLRYDDFKYQLVSTDGGPARTFWVNYFNRFNCYDPVSQTLVTTNPNTGAALVLHAAQHLRDLRAADGFVQRRERHAGRLPRAAAALRRDLCGQPEQRACGSRPASTPSRRAPRSSSTTRRRRTSSRSNQTFYPIGFRQPSHRIYPEESLNFDASWEHQFNGTDASFKFTPFLRTTKNELTTVLLDAKTNFVSGINVGHKNVKGIEFAMQKGDLNRDGFYGALSYTYTFARVKFDKFTERDDAQHGAEQRGRAVQRLHQVLQRDGADRPALPGEHGYAHLPRGRFESRAGSELRVHLDRRGRVLHGRRRRRSDVRGRQHRQSVLEHAGAEPVRPRRGVPGVQHVLRRRARHGLQPELCRTARLHARRQLQEGQVQLHAHHPVPGRRDVRPAAADPRHRPGQGLHGAQSDGARVVDRHRSALSRRSTRRTVRRVDVRGGDPDPERVRRPLRQLRPVHGAQQARGQLVAVVRRLEAGDDPHRHGQRSHQLLGRE